MTETDKPMLLLDASGPECYVGIMRKSAWEVLLPTEEPALESLFDHIRMALDKCALQLNDLGGILYCDGPGSMLGLRLSSLAIRSWRAIPEFSHLPVIVYHRLHVTAALLQLPENSLLITEFKEKKWHALSVSGSLSYATELHTLSYEEIKNTHATVYYLKQRKSWQTLDFEHTPVSYDLQKLPQIFPRQNDLFAPSENPVPFVRESAKYQTWTPERHV